MSSQVSTTAGPDRADLPQCLNDKKGAIERRARDGIAVGGEANGRHARKGIAVRGAVVDIPADTGSADPGLELRQAATTVRQRYTEGSHGYGFWKVTAGIWDRWAERVELGTELSAVAHAEFQAALFSARKYMEMRHAGYERLVLTGELSCARCGYVFAAKEDENVPATELSSRLLGHVCSDALQGA